MNSQKKKSTEVKVHLPSKRQSERPHQLKPVPKNTGAAQILRPTAAPTAYKPQRETKAVQPKVAAPSGKKTAPTTPPVYHPQPTPKVLQAKKAHPGGAGLSQKGGKSTLPIAPQPNAASRPPVSGGAIQRSQKQRDIRGNKIYSGQHGGMWYPSGSSGISDKIWQEQGMTAHEHFTGPKGPATKEYIQLYWSEHPTVTKSQMAARFGITVQKLEEILAG